MRTPEENAPITDICSNVDLVCSVIETVPGEWRLDFDLLDDSPTIVDVNAACDLITIDSSQIEECTNALEDLGNTGGSATLKFDEYGRVFFNDPLFASPSTYNPFAVAHAIELSTASVQSSASNEIATTRQLEPNALTIGILGSIFIIVTSVGILWRWDMKKLALTVEPESRKDQEPVQTPHTNHRIQKIINFLNQNRVKANHLPDADPNIKPQIDSSSPYFTRAHKGVANRLGKRKN